MYGFSTSDVPSREREYAEEHEIFGVAKLRIEHVSIERHHVDFAYAAKGSIERTLTVSDPEVRRALSSVGTSQGAR